MSVDRIKNIEHTTLYIIENVKKFENAVVSTLFYFS